MKCKTNEDLVGHVLKYHSSETFFHCLEPSCRRSWLKLNSFRKHRRTDILHADFKYGENIGISSEPY